MVSAALASSVRSPTAKACRHCYERKFFKLVAKSPPPRHAARLERARALQAVMTRDLLSPATRPSTVEPMVCELIRVRRARASRLVPDSGGKIAEQEPCVAGRDLKDDPPLAMRVRNVDLHTARQTRARFVLLVTRQEPAQRNTLALELLARPSDDFASSCAQPSDVVLEGGLVEVDARAPATRRHLTSSLVIIGERSELLVKPCDLGRGRRPGLRPAMDVVGACARHRVLERAK